MPENRLSLISKMQMTEMELERARADVQIECGRLSKNAGKNIGSVTKHVVEMLTSV